MLTRKRAFLIFFATAVFATLLIFHPVLTDDHLIGFDDPDVVVPMQSVHSISDYLAARRSGKILDVQPVRDASYAFNYFLADQFAWDCFHLINYALWLALGSVLWLLIHELGSSPAIASFVSLYYLCNPIFVGAVCWVSARKHLLSAFFALSATYILVRLVNRLKKYSAPNWRDLSFICVLYFLSCFSQPINVCWPIFALIYLWDNGCKNILLTKMGTLTGFALGAIAIICAIANQDYYTGLYRAQGATKYVDPAHSTLVWKARALGRYAFQAIMPSHPSIWDHAPNSQLNNYGLFLFLVILLGVISKKRDALAWMALFVLALLPVLAQMTNVFAADVYLLIASVGLYVVAAKSIPSALNSAPNWIARPVAIAIIVILIVGAIPMAAPWGSDFQLWQTAYELEPTAKNEKDYAAQLMKTGQYDQALKLSLEAMKQAPGLSQVNMIVGQSAYNDRSITDDQKVDILSAHPGAWTNYFLASVYAARGDFKKSWDLARGFAGAKDYKDQTETISADMFYFCQKADSDSCARIKPLAQKSIGSRDWNDGLFTQRLHSLGIQP